MEEKKIIKMEEKKITETEERPSTGQTEKAKTEVKVEEKPSTEQTEAKATRKAKAKIEAVKATAKKVVKDVAIANGYSLRISPKHSIAICKVIRGKSPEAAVKRLEAVIEGRRAIPMAGLEVAHQKGKGLAGAKFPKNACSEIIGIIKQAGANATTNGIENPVITIAKADRASAPFRKGGKKAKRAHIHIEVRNKSESKSSAKRRTGKVKTK